MRHDAIVDMYGQPAVCLRRFPDELGITVAITERNLVTITALRSRTSCTIPVGSYIRLASSVTELHERASARPGHPFFCGQDVTVRRAPETGGFLEVRHHGKRSGVLLVDAELLMLGNDHAQVIRCAYETAGIQPAHHG